MFVVFDNDGNVGTVDDLTDKLQQAIDDGDATVVECEKPQLVGEHGEYSKLDDMNSNYEDDSSEDEEP